MFGPRHRESLFAVVAVGATLACCSAAFGQVPIALVERYKNDTGTTAKCLMKYLDNYVVREATCDLLPDCEVLQVGGRYTVIKCHGTSGVGSEPPGDSAQIALQGSKRRGGRVLTAEWYENDNCSGYKGEATAVASVEPGLATRAADVTVVNEAHLWDHETNEPGAARGTVYGRQVAYAVVDTWYPLDELDDLFTDPSITWTPLDEFTLNTAGDEAPYSLDGVTPKDIVLFRFYTVQSPVSGSDFELVQFSVPVSLDIPTVTTWGALVMAMLLLTAATLAVLRRRARTT